RETSQVDADHCLELGVNDEADVETRIREAELDVGLVEDEPKGLLFLEPRGTLALTPKLEADEDLLVRQRVGTDAASQEPHQQAGVEILGAQLLRAPLVPPRPERENEGPQLLAGLRRVVIRAAPADTLPALDHPGLLEKRQPLDEQVPRDPGQAELKLTEAVTPEQDLAEDERRPALGEDLRTQSDRAELTVPLHCAELTPLPGANKVVASLHAHRVI